MRVDRGRHRFEGIATPGTEVERARLVTARFSRELRAIDVADEVTARGASR